MRASAALLLAIALLIAASGCARRPALVRIEPARERSQSNASRPRPGSLLLEAVLRAPPPNAPLPLTIAAPLMESATTAPRDRLPDRALQVAILYALGDASGHYSVVVRRLRDGRGATLNSGREYYAASLFKLALLYAAERQRASGLLRFEQWAQVTADDAAEDLGTLATLGIGAGDYLSVGEAIWAMVTRSDNTSAVLVLGLLGGRAVDAEIAALGLAHTSVNTQALPTTAADMALLMEAIVRGDGVSATQRDEMIALLLQQETRVGIPALLPEAVAVGNKTGTWEGATHDVAFVDAPTGRYVIAVLSDRDWDWAPIARVSRAVYDVLAGEP